jgi:hypothetical protein
VLALLEPYFELNERVRQAELKFTSDVPTCDGCRFRNQQPHDGRRCHLLRCTDGPVFLTYRMCKAYAKLTGLCRRLYEAEK